MKHLMIMVAFTAAMTCGAGAEETHRPMTEMHGDCSNFAMDLTHEFKIWNSTGRTEKASVGAVDGTSILSTEAKYELALLPHSSVKFVVSPVKDRGGPDKFSGLVRFEVPKDGVYRVAASNGLWFDIVDGTKLVSESHFEMQTACDSIFKVVEFPLRAGVVYWLQLNGSISDKVGIEITQK
tara:strand:+ start:5030 stop:5572 length:543 start_codon:yes stop_codon:yes gene_type:complete